MEISGIMKRAEEATREEVKGKGPARIKWIVFESQLLDGDQFLLVFDKEDLKEARKVHAGKVIYFPPEVQELYQYRNDVELMRKVHEIKKRFKGWVVPSKESRGKQSDGSKK